MRHARSAREKREAAAAGTHARDGGGGFAAAVVPATRPSNRTSAPPAVFLSVFSRVHLRALDSVLAARGEGPFTSASGRNIFATGLVDPGGKDGGRTVMSAAAGEVGQSSPGGTKQIRLSVGFDTEAWKKQLREEAAEAAKEDALADRMKAAADGGDGGASSSSSSKEAEEIRKKFGVVTSTPSRPPAKEMRVKLQSPSPSPGAPPGGGPNDLPAEKFEGQFDWDSSGYDQVASLTEKNNALMSTLGQQQREIERLKELVVASEAVSGLDAERLRSLQNPNNAEGEQLDPRDAKIVDLAKKNRKMNLALERERTKVRQLSAELDGARKVNAAKTARISKLASGRGGPGRADSSGAVGGSGKELSSALAQNKQMRRQVTTLKRKLDASNADLRKVFRALQRGG